MNENYAVSHSSFEIGIYTLGDIVPDPNTGKEVTAQKRLEEIVEAAKLADEAGDPRYFRIG